MKKILVFLYIAATAIFYAHADNAHIIQNNKINKKQQQKYLVSSNDSISYAYGVSLVLQGLNKYLEAEKITASNPKNLQQFMEGLSESLHSEGKKSAYALGSTMASEILRMTQEFSSYAFENKKADNINIELLEKGITDALSQKNILIDDSEKIISEMFQKAQKREEVEKAEVGSKNKEIGEAFLENNKTKNSVVTLSSGLQYEILTEGKGEKPQKTDKVEVHYMGTFIDGTEFDSSYKRGNPITLGVNQVIPGWTEVLQLMPVGSKWKVYIPYNLAYGAAGGGSIPPYSTLIFEIELLGIK